jgi:DNA-binding response OmpR family regulator
MTRILLTEPDRAIRDLIAGILAEFGHDVVSTENVIEAEIWAATSPIDVLVTDLVLHGEQGLALSRSCAALGIRTVTLTGREFHPDETETSRLPSLLEKPFRFSDLQRVLHAVEPTQPPVTARRPTTSAA